MLHQIGIGTLGPVFRTYEPTRDRLVAVKAFRLDIVPEQAQALAAGLSRAAQASLCHPSIVEPIEAGVEGTVAYRAEEYVAAESLDVAMRHYAPAPIEKVLPFITQLAGAIDFARAAGIGHGGLHPRDIFVTPDEARATGFGVVDALEQVGIRAPIRRPYSAPERIDGRAWTTSADVFSLAAITFELLSGKRPSGTGAGIGSLADGAHAAALHAVLARAMDDDPSKRHATALAFAAALDAAAHGRRITEVVPVVEPPKAEVPKVEIPKVEIPKVEPPPPAVPTAAFVEPVPVASAAADEPIVAMTPTPGEFDIEAALDPVPERDDLAGRTARPPVAAALTLFDDEQEREDEAVKDTPREERFAFEPDEKVVAPFRDHEPARPEDALEAAMFHGAEPDVGLTDVNERGRPAILPYAVVSVLMLLVGFAAGYFVRDRAAAGQDTRDVHDIATSPAAPVSAGPSSGRATAEKAGQYSEQKVTPSQPATPPSTAAATPAPAGVPAVARPAPAPAPAAAKGQIVVRSVPSHAGVTVNGTWRGRTPLTLDDVGFGNYVVRVVQPGYLVARDEFILNAHTPSRTFAPRLERAAPAVPAPAPAPPAAAAQGPFTGSLYVDSRPRGASVIVDGKTVGQTPVSLPDVPVGSHVVKIELQGKKPVTAAPRVTAGKLERVTVSLEDKQE